jgi:hypothetical protein
MIAATTPSTIVATMLISCRPGMIALAKMPITSPAIAYQSTSNSPTFSIAASFGSDPSQELSPGARSPTPVRTHR